MALEEVVGVVLERPQRLGGHSSAVEFGAVLVERPSQNGGAEALWKPEFDVVAGVVEAPGQVARGTCRAAVRGVTRGPPTEDVVGRGVRPALVGVEEPHRLFKRVRVIEGRLPEVWAKCECQENKKCCEQVWRRPPEQATLSSNVFLAHCWLLRKNPRSGGHKPYGVCHMAYEIWRTPYSLCFRGIFIVFRYAGAR